MITLKKRRNLTYLILTAILSFVSLVIVCTSFGTQYWITGYTSPVIGIDFQGPSIINYGLFEGTLIRKPIYRPHRYDIYFTCYWASNSCAWSCADNKYSRIDEVRRLIIQEIPTFDCPDKYNSDPDEMTTIAPWPVQTTTTPNWNGNSYRRVFTNGKLWIAIIVFFSITLITIFVSLVLSIINCISNPKHKFLNVQGICIMNEIAMCTNFFVLLFYGISYDLYITKNIGILDTFNGYYQSNAKLGYSYWILLGSFFFQGLGILAIVLREKCARQNQYI